MVANSSKSKTPTTDEQVILTECKRHAELGFQETDRRATGKNRVGTISFNEADELFRSWLDEKNWPYDALLFDPRVFTFIFEKTSRLIANKPQGHLSPRGDSGELAARINNELLSYQWDQANLGGSMISKWSLMDITTRKYGAAFALTKWRYEVDKDGRVVFDGPDMQVLNNRDIAHDLSATSIESCNWFQVRQYVTIQELERVNDASRSKPIYKNLDKLKIAVQSEGNTQSGGEGSGVNYLSRSRSIAGLELDPKGQDPAFKTVELITEYRKDRWITFAWKHGIVVRDIPNPYKNNEIPIIMLRYYAVDDDLYGLSEIEPVKGIQKAINALLCQYVDEINQKLYSPIAIGPGVRQHTLEWGKGARWIMNNPMTDFRLVESRSNAAQYFNNTYSVLVASMMNALGESSLGVSNTQPYQQNKTATEVKALQLQRNARDQYNQIFLAEAIKRQYLLWHTMNQVLLFSDPKTMHYVIRLSGDDALRYFQQQGLDEMEYPEGASEQALADENSLRSAMAGNSEMLDIPGVETSLHVNPDAYMKPKYGIKLGDEKNPELVTKLKMEDNGRSGILYIEPSDVNGQFDFSINVESMAVNSDEERKTARQQAVQLLTTNPLAIQLLSQEGYQPKLKELIVKWLEDIGFNDADQFFSKAGGAGGAGGGNPQEMLQQLLGSQGGGATSGAPTTGIPGGTNPNVGGETQSTNPFSVNTSMNLSKLQNLGLNNG